MRRNEMSKPLVSIVMGSDSDLDIMQEAANILDELRIGYELTITSAHRTPERTFKYASAVEERGLEVIIAGAGGAAHLPGVIAALTTIPVIGVPMPTEALNGVVSLYSMVQMPSGVPVATMAIGRSGAKNAALLAGAILGLKYPAIKEKLKKYREDLKNEVERKADLLSRNSL